MKPLTADQKKAVIEITAVFAKIIQLHGRIPSGELYARVMDKINLQNYQFILDVLVEMKMIKIVAHELIWIGNE